MSNSRARALAYAKNVASTRSNRREKQPDVFNKSKAPISAPAFMINKQDDATDVADETRALRTEEKKISNDQEKDIVDKQDFVAPPPTGKAPPPRKSTVASAAPDPELKSAFAKCWTTVDTLDIPALQHQIKSWWFPSGIAIFEILSNMERILDGNEELHWVSPHYFSLPVRVYYAVIFHIQVLRAKQEAGTITKAEGSWLRAFFRRYKDVACPIAGPLVPVFSNIVSILPDDDQFDYVYPTLPEPGSYRVTQATTSGTVTRTLDVFANHHLIPSVVLLASLLREFCTGQLNNAHFENENYVPFTLAAGGVFAGAPLAANDRQTSYLLQNPGISHPLPESRVRLADIRGFWRRSLGATIPDIPNNQPYDQNGPGAQTLMVDNFDWFECCLDMANVQTKFFSDSTNLSSIPTIGGMSPTIVAHLTFTRHNPQPVNHRTWYPDTFSASTATFRATAASLELDHKFNAIFSLTNATFAWQTAAGHDIGTIAAGHRAGPYWQGDHPKITYELDNDVRVMNGLFTLLQTHFYEARAGAKSN